MKCPKCQFDNREGIKFCEECGAKMELTCPACGAEIPFGRKFCGECGHKFGKLKETPSIDYTQPQSYTPDFLADKILTSRRSLEGERKHVTVLLADIKDSTEMIKDLDPEAAQQLLDPAIHGAGGAGGLHRPPVDYGALPSAKRSRYCFDSPLLLPP